MTLGNSHALVLPCGLITITACGSNRASHENQNPAALASISIETETVRTASLYLQKLTKSLEDAQSYGLLEGEIKAQWHDAQESALAISLPESSGLSPMSIQSFRR